MLHKHTIITLNSHTVKITLRTDDYEFLNIISIAVFKVLVMFSKGCMKIPEIMHSSKLTA